MSSALMRHAIRLTIAMVSVTGIVRADASGERNEGEPEPGVGGPIVLMVSGAEDNERTEQRRRDLALVMLQAAYGEALSTGDMRRRAGLAQMIDGIENRVRESATRAPRTGDGREIQVSLPANCKARRRLEDTKSAEAGRRVATLEVRRARQRSPMDSIFFP